MGEFQRLIQLHTPTFILINPRQQYIGNKNHSFQMTHIAAQDIKFDFEEHFESKINFII